MQYEVFLGDFNLNPNNPIKFDFLNYYDLTNLIRRNTGFKEDDPCIDLALTNCKFSFKFSTIFEIGLSGHHYLIFSMIKTTFEKEEPKLLIYCDFKKLTLTNFQYEFSILIHVNHMSIGLLRNVL